MKKDTYEIKVWVDEDDINLLTIYKIEAINASEAEGQAKDKFRAEILAGNLKRKLRTFVINNPDNYKNYVLPYLDEIKRNI